LSAPGALTGALNSSADAKSASPIDPVIAAPLAASQGFAQIQEGVAAEASQTARPLAQPNPVDQIKVQLSKSLKDGADTLSVQLHPEDLGRVEVKLEMQNGQVKATVTADRPETLQMLKNDSSSLQQSLNNAGLNTDANSLSFHLRGEQQQQQRQASENGSGGFSNGRNEAPEDDIPDATLASNTALSWTTGGGNGIDINV
jgi:flagellar hook-length control protein FliK